MLSMRPNQIKQQQKLQINFTFWTVIRLNVLGTDIWNPNFNVSLVNLMISFGQVWVKYVNKMTQRNI